MNSQLVSDQNFLAKQGPRILIAEDEPAHAEAIRRALEAANWTNLEVVETLEEFRTSCAALPPKIALVDLNLPDGRATELLNPSDGLREFPLIIMTCRGDQNTVLESLKAGAFDYLIKSDQIFLELPRILTRIQREWTLLHERTELLNEAKAIYELSQDLICVASTEGYFLRVNPAFHRILGYTAEELCGQSLVAFVQPDHRDRAMAEIVRLSQGLNSQNFSTLFLTKEGQYCWLEWNASLAPNGHQIYAVGRDITARKRAEEKIHLLAFYDELTTLPNRRLFADRLHHVMAAGARTLKHAALLFIDLDNFKTINDTQGHKMGDLLLVEVAKRIQTCVRDVDTVARLGGDEFVVMLEDLSKNKAPAAEQAMLVGEKIREEAAQPYNLDGLEYHSSASIGIHLFCGESTNSDDLLKYADTAMYQAKNAGRNALRFFDPKMQSELANRVLLENELRHALERQQLKLYFQLQVNAQGAVVGAECLLRWLHPEYGLVPPLHFIPLAEASGLIFSIGDWVLRTACAQIKTWQANPLTAHFQLAVNVSARQFRQPNFVEQVLGMVKAAEINPYCLKLELTESLVLDNIEKSILTMQALRDAGVRLSMDDFGTGQSSLTYLRRLPLDQLKIDQSFVRDIFTDEGSASIVKTIIVLAQNLGMEVIAEGVETQQQREFLEQQGCRLHQGYLFGKPVPIEEFKTEI